MVSRGQLKEFDTPYQLLQNPRSQLRRMVEKTGPSASRKLHQMALDAHLKQKKLEQRASLEATKPSHNDLEFTPLLISEVNILGLETAVWYYKAIFLYYNTL